MCLCSVRGDAPRADTPENRIVSKSDEEISRLYEEIWLPVYHRAYQALQCRETAEEVAYNVVIAVWRKYTPNHESGAGELTFAFAVCDNACKHLLRQQRKELEVFDELSRCEPLTCDLTGHSPYDENRLDNAERQELMQLLSTAIERLSPKQRAVIRFARFEGLSLREIAAKLNCSEGSVSQSLRKAKKRLIELAHDMGLADYL